MLLRLLDSLRCFFNSLENRFDLPIKQTDFIVHLKELSIGVVSHTIQYLSCEFLFMLDFDSPLSLNSFEFFNVAGCLFSAFLLLVGLELGCEGTLGDATLNSRRVVRAHVRLFG